MSLDTQDEIQEKNEGSDKSDIRIERTRFNEVTLAKKNSMSCTISATAVSLKKE